jgi:hypothetical protein
MKLALMSLSVVGPKANFKVRKEPFGLSLSKPLAPPFGLSLSKPSCLMPKASAGSARPFDKLRANGGGEHVDASGSGEPTAVNSLSGPRAELRFMRHASQPTRWSR